MRLEDGTGTGYKVKVDNTNKLSSRAVIEPGSVEAALNGDFYFVTCGEVTLTSASASAVLWFQNEESYDLVMDRITFTAGASTGGTTNVCKLASTISPTGLGSGSGTVASAVNSNLGSSTTLTMTSSEIGQEAATVTGGTAGPAFYFPDKDTSEFPTEVIIPKGTGLAWSVTPPTSNTSLTVSVSMDVHKSLL